MEKDRLVAGGIAGFVGSVSNIILGVILRQGYYKEITSFQEITIPSKCYKIRRLG